MVKKDEESGERTALWRGSRHDYEETIGDRPFKAEFMTRSQPPAILALALPRAGEMYWVCHCRAFDMFS